LLDSEPRDETGRKLSFHPICSLGFSKRSEIQKLVQDDRYGELSESKLLKYHKNKARISSILIEQSIAKTLSLSLSLSLCQLFCGILFV
jgi:hypothetical protein